MCCHEMLYCRIRCYAVDYILAAHVANPNSKFNTKNSALLSFSPHKVSEIPEICSLVCFFLFCKAFTETLGRIGQ